ncbi:MAG: alanine racemase [Lachnospiraceae bacterium]
MTKHQYTRVYAEINLDAAAANIQSLKDRLPPGIGMLAAVKADGYGHGSVPVAMAIEPYVSGYIVAAVDEARQLCRHGVQKPVLVLGVTHPDRYPDLLEDNIRTTVFTMEQALPLSELAVAAGQKARIHLAVDTGMNRIGMRADESGADLATAIAKLPGIEVEGLYTHFARADECDKVWARKQLEVYLHFVELLDQRGISIPYKHCANSAGMIDLPETHMNLVRPGIAIYGMYPSDEVSRENVALQPVMALKSQIIYVKTIPAGSQVSYGGTFCAQQEMRIATVPVGYGDGYSRNLSNQGQVLIRGQKAPILGRICMDQFMVDVSEIPEASVGDIVTLMGMDGRQQIRAEDLAAWSGGFHYEVVCNIGKRIPRVYISHGGIVGCKDYFDDIYHGFGGL